MLPVGSYVLKLNHRGLINRFFTLVLEIDDVKQQTELMRLLDKYHKLKKDVFEEECQKLGIEHVSVIHDFMKAENLHDLKHSFISLANDNLGNSTFLLKSLTFN